MTEQQSRRNLEVASKLRIISSMYDQKRKDLFESLQSKHEQKCSFKPNRHKTRNSKSYQSTPLENRRVSEDQEEKEDVSAPNTFEKPKCRPQVYERLFQKSEHARKIKSQGLVKKQVLRDLEQNVQNDDIKKRVKIVRSKYHSEVVHREPLYKPEFLIQRDKKRSEEKEKSQEQCSFSPAINTKSRKMASRLSECTELPRDVHCRLFAIAAINKAIVPTVTSPREVKIELDLESLLAEEELNEEKSELSDIANSVSEIDMSLPHEPAEIVNLDKGNQQDAEIFDLESTNPVDESCDDTQQLIEFKVEDYLVYGVPVKKHGRRGKPHTCSLRADIYSLFWTSKDGEWNRFSWEKILNIASGNPGRRSSFDAMLKRRLSSETSIPEVAAFLTVSTDEKDLVLELDDICLRDKVVNDLSAISDNYFENLQMAPKGENLSVVSDNDSISQKLAEIEQVLGCAKV